jgi:hypothetical protein
MIYGESSNTCLPTLIQPKVTVNESGLSGMTAIAEEGQTVVLGTLDSGQGIWNWTGPNGFTATTQEINFSNVTADNEGVYNVTYTNESGCQSAPATFILVLKTKEEPTGVEPLFNNKNLFIYPNPSNSGNFTIENSFQGKLDVVILDTQQKSLYNECFNASDKFIKVHVNLPAGIYLVKIGNGEKWSFRKLVVQ